MAADAHEVVTAGGDEGAVPDVAEGPQAVGLVTLCAAAHEVVNARLHHVHVPEAAQNLSNGQPYWEWADDRHTP